MTANTTPPEPLAHSLEPQLRALGMPTELRRGVPTLLREFRVCKKGEQLSAQQVSGGARSSDALASTFDSRDEY